MEIFIHQQHKDLKNDMFKTGSTAMYAFSMVTYKPSKLGQTGLIFMFCNQMK